MLDSLFEAEFHVLAEIVIRIPGDGLLRLAYPKDNVDPDGFGTFAVGCLFWVLFAGCGVVAWTVVL
jgi:hypothetical protein